MYNEFLTKYYTLSKIDQIQSKCMAFQKIKSALSELSKFEISNNLSQSTGSVN